MKTLSVQEARANLSALIKDVQHGEEIAISRYGKPVAKLVPLSKGAERALGFYPIAFTSDLSTPTEDAVLRDFEEADLSQGGQR